MDKDQEIERLRQENQELKSALQQALATIAQLTTRVEDLERQLKKDSRNSHLPPSSDRFARQPKSLRPKSEKRSGGQKGHRGHHLMMVKTPDETIVHALHTCEHCQQDLRDEPVCAVERRQLIDVPVPKAVVIEHLAHHVRCPNCHHNCTAAFPEQIAAAVQYGSGIRALAVSLSMQHLLPDQRVCRILQDLLGIRISPGSLHRWIAQCANHLVGVEQQIKTALTQAPVMHQDETGLYVMGQRHWMHVACTKDLTHYAVHCKRGREAMDEIGIAPLFSGVSVHDGWSSYQGYVFEHALCNVHHLRELTFVHEELGQAWAGELKDLLQQMSHAVEAAKVVGQRELDPRLRAEFEARYHAWLRSADGEYPPDPPPLMKKRGRVGRSLVRRLIDRLRSQHEQVLLFLHNFAVPFDNSQAERDIRMVKVQQKVSGCFRSQEGATAFCRIRGYLSTMAKQGHHLLSVLEMALVGHPLSPSF